MYAESTISSEDRWPFMYDESDLYDHQLSDRDLPMPGEYDLPRRENDADLPDTPSGVNSFNAIGQFVEDVKLWTDCLEYVLEERRKTEEIFMENLLSGETYFFNRCEECNQRFEKEMDQIRFEQQLEEEERQQSLIDAEEAHQLSLKEDKLYANFFEEDVELTSAEILQEYKKTCQLAKQQVKPPQWKFGNK